MKQLLQAIGGLLLGIYVLTSGLAYLDGVDPIHYEAALTGEPVVMFSTHSCGYCKKARQFLDQRGVAYQELFIDESELAYEHFKSLGGRGVPLIVVQDELIEGYNPAALSEALAKI